MPRPKSVPATANPNAVRFVGAVVALGLALILVIGWVAGATWRSVPVDKIALHYTGGPFQGTRFKSVIAPGTKNKYYGQLENLYELPATQRTYLISRDPNLGDKKGADQVYGTSNDNVLFSFEAVVYFKLNTDPKVIRPFFEQICLHDDCTDLSPGGGWDKMLAQYFRPALESAVRFETGKYSREQLWHDPATLATIQQAIGPELNTRINAAVGGEYFCGPDSTPSRCTDFGFILKDPTPPQQVIDSYAATAAATQGVVTAQQQANAKVEAAKGDANAQRERANAPAVPPQAVDYIRAQAERACADNDKCTLVIVNGQPGSVNVNTGPR